MAYFNYFIKQFLRVFVKKFFWIILIAIVLFFVLNTVSFGAVNYSFFDYYYYDTTTPSIVIDSFTHLPEFSNNLNMSFLIYTKQGNYLALFAPTANISELRVYTSSLAIMGSYPLTIYTIRSDGSIANSSTIQASDWYLTSLNAPSVDVGYQKYIKNVGVKANFTLNSQYIFSSEVLPFIQTSSSDVENWSFDYLVVDLGTYSPYYTHIDQQVLKTFLLDISYNDTTYHVDITPTLQGTNFIIPKNMLTQYFVVRDNSTISFSLSAYSRFLSDTDYFSLSSYTLSLTSAQQSEINEDSEKYNSGEILSQTEQINNNLDNLNNTLTDSSVEDITIDSLPQDNTTDITQEGINGIFTSIYNAFCTGQAQDIVFPIPFTDKSITIPATYTYDSLISSNANFLIIFIQAFWWYIISRFIIKDIANKINKIKSGNIESIEKTNIKEEML